MGSSKWRVILGVVLLAIIAFGYEIWRRRDPVVPQHEATSFQPTARHEQRGFVGSQACRKCHPKQFESFSKHPMGQSMAAVGAASAEDAENVEMSFSPTPSRKYVVEKKENRLVHHEIGLDQEGNPIYDQAEEIDYVMGSGRRGKSYMINRDGILYMSPISWYSQQKRWDLAPGYDPKSHPRFDRRVPERCVQCHTGRMSHVRTPKGADYERYKDPPFLEESIGCERCHGPGESHIEWQHESQHTTKDPMLRLSSLAPTKRDDVCNQCHLVGDFQVLRQNRAHSDFRPGDHLGDIWTVFLSQTGVDDAESTIAVSQVEQMQQSRCYVASKGKLGCITCHEPHSLPEESKRAAHFDSRCIKCHEPQHCSLPSEERQKNAPAGSCIHCHMPRLSAKDVPHTTQTDHRIRRDPKKSQAQPDSEPAEALRIYEYLESPLTPAEEGRARGLLLAERAKTERNPQLAQLAATSLSQYGPTSTNDIRVMDAMAFCGILAGRPQVATDLWTKIAKEADDPEIYDSLAGQLIDRGEITRAIEAVDKSIALDPWKGERHLRRSRLMFQRGQLDLAIDSAKKALELSPADPRIYQWLSELHRLAGNEELGTEYETKRARLLGPTPRK